MNIGRRPWQILWNWNPKRWCFARGWWPRADPAPERIFRWWRFGPLEIRRFKTRAEIAEEMKKEKP